MKRIKILIILLLIMCIILIPFSSIAITTDEVDMNNFFKSYNKASSILLYILISIIIIDVLISAFIISKNRKNNKSIYIRYSILLFEVTLLLYFIGIRFFYNIWDGMNYYFETSAYIGYCCLALSFISNVVQIITIKCNSKIEKILFIIFVLLGIVSIIGVIISGKVSINNVIEKLNGFKTWRKANPIKS